MEDKNIYDGVTVMELLSGYAIYKNLINANLLKEDKETKTVTIDGDETIRFLEKQNLELKLQLEDVIRNANIEKMEENRWNN